VNNIAGPSGLAINIGFDDMNRHDNICAKSMNSDAFSQFSLPSNNILVNQLNQKGFAH